MTDVILLLVEGMAETLWLVRVLFQMFYYTGHGVFGLFFSTLNSTGSIDVFQFTLSAFWFNKNTVSSDTLQILILQNTTVKSRHNGQPVWHIHKESNHGACCSVTYKGQNKVEMYRQCLWKQNDLKEVCTQHVA